MPIVSENNLAPAPGAPTAYRYRRRSDRSLTVAIAHNNSRRKQIHSMRHEYYTDTLTTIGVRLWDRYDDVATHFICTDENGQPVASMRTLINTDSWGEIADDFADLPDLRSGRAHQFVSFSRELVVPRLRLTSVASVLSHAVASWWLRLDARLEVLLTSLASTASGPERYGCRPVSEVRHLGPHRVPVVLMSGSLPEIASRAGTSLSRRGWDCEELHEVDPG